MVAGPGPEDSRPVVGNRNASTVPGRRQLRVCLCILGAVVELQAVPLLVPEVLGGVGALAAGALLGTQNDPAMMKDAIAAGSRVSLGSAQ